MMDRVNFDDEVESMARSVKRAAFRTTRFGTGYDQDEVNAFLSDAIDKVRQGECVHPPCFSQTRLRAGYVMSDVDSLIAEFFRLGPPPVSAQQAAQQQIARQQVPRQPSPVQPTVRRVKGR